MRELTTMILEREGRIARLTLNRPERLNAVSAAMHEELSHVFRDIAGEPAIDLLVLTGAGRAFSSGGDAGFLQQMYQNEDVIEQVTRQGREIILSLLDLNIPVIAAVNGDAIGLGASIALCCDCVIAADTARFGDPHVRMGLVAGDGGAVIWPRLIGPARAKEYLLTGKLIAAPEAERLGLINAAVPLDELWPAVQELAEGMLRWPQSAVRGTKRAINRSMVQAAGETLEFSLSLEAQTMHSEDFAEAVRAFVEKRQPEFRSR